MRVSFRHRHQHYFSPPAVGARADALTTESPLLGALPELDSMAVVSILTALEDHFDFTVDDDEISAETFATLGSLIKFVERKLNS